MVCSDYRTYVYDVVEVGFRFQFVFDHIRRSARGDQPADESFKLSIDFHDRRIADSLYLDLSITGVESGGGREYRRDASRDIDGTVYDDVFEWTFIQFRTRSGRLFTRVEAR